MTSAADLWPDAAARRRLGAYYTPSPAAALMADWVAHADGETVLEPSFGDGVFLRALTTTRHERQIRVDVRGVEIDPAAHRRAVEQRLIEPGSAVRGDFLAERPVPVAGAVGNPPYVRLRHLPAAQRERALAVAARVMGREMDPAGSVWMPFVLHACEFLRPGGRLAFVLPYDVTYVRYARPLWSHLAATFGRLHLVRVHERLFPEILQDTVLLFADGKGRSTSSVGFSTYESVRQLVQGTPSASADIAIHDIVAGERPFVRALLSRELAELLDHRLAPLTRPARDLVTFNIGYVAGDKRFFHPDPATVRRYSLPARSLVPSVTSARQLSGHGVRTSALGEGAVSRLFLPSRPRLTAGETRYVAEGERLGVSDRYKCRVRSPWYVVPYVRVPDVVLSVFTERPLLLVNDAAMVASNSLLCGYAKPGVDIGSFAASWYSSLTLLQAELEVHSLGGGVFVLVPNEAGRIRVPVVTTRVDRALSRIDKRLSAGDLAGAYAGGDTQLLVRGLGLRTDDVDLIRDGVARLAHWRLAAQSTPG